MNLPFLNFKTQTPCSYIHTYLNIIPLSLARSLSFAVSFTVIPCSVSIHRESLSHESDRNIVVLFCIQYMHVKHIETGSIKCSGTITFSAAIATAIAAQLLGLLKPCVQAVFFSFFWKIKKTATATTENTCVFRYIHRTTQRERETGWLT